VLLDESEARRRVIFTTRFEANVGRRTSTLRLYTTPYYCTTYWTLNVVGVFIGVRDTRSPGRTRHRSYRTTPGGPDTALSRKLGRPRITNNTFRARPQPAKPRPARCSCRCNERLNFLCGRFLFPDTFSPLLPFFNIIFTLAACILRKTGGTGRARGR
jgi:hypothetical protein